MKRYEDNLNDKSWIEHLLNAVKNNSIKNKSYSTLGVISWDANVFFVNATKSYLIDKDIESYKRNMYVGSKLSIMGEDSRNFLVYDRRTMFRILASNNQDLIHFIKKYPELLTYRIKNKFLKQDIQSYLTKTVLLAFLGKWEEVLDRYNTYFQNKPASGYYNLASVEFDFLNALAEKNVEQMKKNIDKMLDKKIARKLVYNMDRKFEFWLQMYAVMYLKIALYHGYDFEIDCDICPKDLIDNTPAKEYPEPFEFMNKFDLKTITPEKWKEWIYEYCKNKEELLEDEKAGYFIQTIIVGENSNLSIDKTENIAAIIGTTDNGKISPKAPNTSVIYDKVDKEQTTRATAINTEISLKGKEISAEELGFNTDKEKSQEVTKDNEKHLNEQFIEAKAIPKDERENYKVVLLKINATKGVYGLSGSIGPIYNKNPLTNEEEFGIVFGGRGLFGVDFNYEKFDMSDGKFLLNLDFDFESYEKENQPMKQLQLDKYLQIV